MEAREAVNTYGGIRPAARALGIPESTLRTRLNKENGFAVKGESTLYDKEGNVVLQWVKTREDNTVSVVEAIKDALSEYSGRSGLIPKPVVANGDLLTVYPLPDLHFGLYAWGPEAGEDWDIKIAQEVAERSVSRLVAQSQPSEHAVVLGLGDYFHSNDRRAVTPKSLHPLDVDGRWAKVLKAGAALAVKLVELVAAKHETVEVVFLQGNHDEDAAIALTVALGLYYDNHSRITVTDNANVVWGRKFGVNLLTATHGHTIRPGNFAAVVAADFAEDWGSTLYRHGFMGHIHHETAKEVPGMRVETFQTPIAKDAYAASYGYRAGRSLSAITFHLTDGEIGRHRVNIPQAVRSAR